MVSLLARRRAYQVGYRLKLAELRHGRVVGAYFAPAARCFATNELNVILAEIYLEVGPSPYLLGLEIQTVRRLAGSRRPLLYSAIP